MNRRIAIMIAHHYSTIAKANRVVVMDKEQVIQIGTHRSLIKERSSLYFRLAGKQMAKSKII